LLEVASFAGGLFLLEFWPGQRWGNCRVFAAKIQFTLWGGSLLLGDPGFDVADPQAFGQSKGIALVVFWPSTLP
jgi:hypothetical protein